MTVEETIATERRLLQWLCQGEMEASVRDKLLARLRSYAFRSVEHQVLFDCLGALPPERPELIKSLIPARLIRAGFPDFDLKPFFQPHGLSPAKAMKLCGKLVVSASLQ